MIYQNESPEAKLNKRKLPRPLVILEG